MSAVCFFSCYPNLTLFYTILCSLPDSSASAERTVSKLKIVKKTDCEPAYQIRLLSERGAIILPLVHGPSYMSVPSEGQRFNGGNLFVPPQQVKKYMIAIADE